LPFILLTQNDSGIILNVHIQIMHQRDQIPQGVRTNASSSSIGEDLEHLELHVGVLLAADEVRPQRADAVLEGLQVVCVADGRGGVQVVELAVVPTGSVIR
jgi:hypothetical protein